MDNGFAFVEFHADKGNVKEYGSVYRMIVAENKSLQELVRENVIPPMQAMLEHSGKVKVVQTEKGFDIDCPDDYTMNNTEIMACRALRIAFAMLPKNAQDVSPYQAFLLGQIYAAAKLSVHSDAIQTAASLGAPAKDELYLHFGKMFNEKCRDYMKELSYREARLKALEAVNNYLTKCGKKAVSEKTVLRWERFFFDHSKR